MPTSATTTCRTAGAAGRAAGFTLLELLVVVALVAILTGTVILGFTGADAEQRLKGSADRLAYAVEMARQYALQRNREWGLYVEPDGVTFAEFDPEREEWREQSQRPFGRLDLTENVDLRVEAEGLDALTGAQKEDLPEVILFSSGEVTPFTLHLEPAGDALPWTVSSDGISRVSAERVEF